MAEKYGAHRAYADPQELLADPEIDGVSICTWNNSHATWAIAAIEAGKHVLVEKPIARTLEEAEEIQRTVEASDRVVQVGFVRRHSANCQVLKSFIDADELGEIYYAKASCIRRVGNPGGWFADKEIAGGGPLLDIGIHVLDLCWYLMGSPKVVSVSGNTYDRLGNRANVTTMPRYTVADYDPTKNTVEDLANAVIRFENGASLLLDCSYSLHATQRLHRRVRLRREGRRGARAGPAHRHRDARFRGEHRAADRLAHVRVRPRLRQRDPELRGRGPRPR